MENSRRDFLKKAAILSGAALVACTPLKSVADEPEKKEEEKPGDGPLQFSLAALPYGFDSLEPYVDKMTMEIHHGKHHQAYVTNLNKALTEQKIYTGTLADIVGNISKYNTATRNNAGGHWNHTEFWKWMRPNGQRTYAGKIADAVNGQFGTLEKFKEQFTDAAMKRFGSGWTWLIQKDGKLEIATTPNQDNPLMDIAEVKGKPVLGLDVWEHAYYLKYQNLRKDYITNWYNVVNWDRVAELMS